MAALLRQGARRIGGRLFQRAQAAVTSPAVAEERRRLVRRRMYGTKEQPYGGTSRETQRKIDELYDLISMAEKYDINSNLSSAWLLPHLSTRVTPRPSDSDWCEMKSVSEFLLGIKSGGISALILLAVYYYNG